MELTCPPWPPTDPTTEAPCRLHEENTLPAGLMADFEEVGAFLEEKIKREPRIGHTWLTYYLWLKAGGGTWALPDKPDSALTCVLRTLPLSNDYPELRVKTRKALRASVNTLLDRGLSPWPTWAAGDAPGPDQWCLLPWAVRHGMRDIVTRCLEHPDAPPVAVWEQIPVLLGKNVSVPALHACLHLGHLKLARVLMKAGASLTLLDKRGLPPASWIEAPLLLSKTREIFDLAEWCPPDLQPTVIQGAITRLKREWTTNKKLVEHLSVPITHTQNTSLGENTPTLSLSDTILSSLTCFSTDHVAYPHTLLHQAVGKDPWTASWNRKDDPSLPVLTGLKEALSVFATQERGTLKGTWTWSSALLLQTLLCTSKREDHRERKPRSARLYTELASTVTSWIEAQPEEVREAWLAAKSCKGQPQSVWYALMRGLGNTVHLLPPKEALETYVAAGSLLATLSTLFRGEKKNERLEEAGTNLIACALKDTRLALRDYWMTFARAEYPLAHVHSEEQADIFFLKITTELGTKLDTLSPQELRTFAELLYRKADSVTTYSYQSNRTTEKLRTLTSRTMDMFRALTRILGKHPEVLGWLRDRPSPFKDTKVTIKGISHNLPVPDIWSQKTGGEGWRCLWEKCALEQVLPERPETGRSARPRV